MGTEEGGKANVSPLDLKSSLLHASTWCLEPAAIVTSSLVIFFQCFFPPILGIKRKERGKGAEMFGV